MLKDCQLITTFEVDWLIVVVLPVCEMFACPPATTPPVGETAWAAIERASITAAVSEFRTNPFVVWVDFML